MNILFLAPQPFFQERGTPIAVRLAVEVLARRSQDHVDLLTYHEGEEILIANVSQRRIRAPKWLKEVGPGISFKKLFCDVSFFFSALGMVRRKRKNPYHLVHAVEEAVFIAWLIKRISGIPYIYDMDSALVLQLTEKWRWLRPLNPLLTRLERLVVRESKAVVPVCDALAAVAEKQGSLSTYILRDISLLDLNGEAKKEINLRQEAGLAEDSQVVLYIGNLEAYQGIELLLKSFAKSLPHASHTALAIIGGSAAHIEKYSQLSERLGIKSLTRFLGKRPVEQLSAYLHQADILASPRTKGNNTPMKIYSYLHSGRTIIATDLSTHTQVLNNRVAMLAPADPEAFGEALKKLINDRDLRNHLGSAAHQLATERYTYQVFERDLNAIYDSISSSISA